jgi:hypothetical protein
MEKEQWDSLQEDLEAARETVHADPTDENRAAYKALAKEVAEARSAWRADEEVADRRPGPNNPEDSMFRGGGVVAEGVAAAGTVEASGGVHGGAE